MDGKINLVTVVQPTSAVAEAYRALRFNLNFANLDNSLETLVVASPAVDQTKSQVAANLAVAVAQSGKQVVLVDADLRRPSLHNFFGVSQEPGLSNALIGQEREYATALIETAVEGLRILPSGVLPPNPADILASQKMDHFLEILKGCADLVIFDVPPVTVSVDAAVLAAKTDGLLLVVRSGHTRRDHLEHAKQILERAHIRLLGAILTDAPDGGLWTAY
ncbi:MAG: CpsD/CapB family tyrosine-protein kinase [Anaerolineae bacterium]|nr:CpsD/CapB family tyrosine-protein kinase [Anaerolineae bacterium]